MNLFSLQTLSSYVKAGHAVPAFVKEAGLMAETDISGLPPASFADPMRRLPTHTKAATWLSCLAFYSGDAFDPTGVAPVKLEKAAAYWNIQGECQQIAEVMSKKADVPTDADFAMVAEVDGHRIRRFPVRGPGNVKESAVELEKCANQYPYHLRRNAAKAILKRANELGVKLANHITLERTAGLGIGDPSLICQSLRLRAAMVKDAEIRQRLLKLAEATKGMEPKLDAMDKLAGLIDAADRAAGLYKYYGVIQTPEELCYTKTSTQLQEKRASFIELTTGHAVPKEKLAQMEADRFSALGDDFVTSIAGADGRVDVKKAEEIVPTLPADDARLFANSL